MKRFRKATCAALALALLMGVSTFFAPKALADTTTKTLQAAFTGVKLVINGQTVTPKDANGKTIEPFVVDKTAYLPVETVVAALGNDVVWSDNTLAITALDTVRVIPWGVDTLYLSETKDKPTVMKPNTQITIFAGEESDGLTALWLQLDDGSWRRYENSAYTLSFKNSPAGVHSLATAAEYGDLLSQIRVYYFKLTE